VRQSNALLNLTARCSPARSSALYTFVTRSREAIDPQRLSRPPSLSSPPREELLPVSAAAAPMPAISVMAAAVPRPTKRERRRRCRTPSARACTRARSSASARRGPSSVGNGGRATRFTPHPIANVRQGAHQAPLDRFHGNSETRSNIGLTKAGYEPEREDITVPPGQAHHGVDHCGSQHRVVVVSVVVG